MVNVIPTSFRSALTVAEKTTFFALKTYCMKVSNVHNNMGTHAILRDVQYHYINWIIYSKHGDNQLASV